MHKRLSAISLALVLVLSLVGSAAAAAIVTVVDDGDISSLAPPQIGKTWYTADTRSGGTLDLVSGPATPALGTGSLEMTANSAIAGDAKAQLFNYDAFGIVLSSLDALSFDAYRSSASTTGPAPAISLNVAIYANGGTSGFSTLVWEPVYQLAGAGAITSDTWQTWDAFTSGNDIWWSTRPIAGVCATACYVPWSTITSNNTAATIIGVAFNFGSGVTGSFIGNADALTVGISGNSTTYDFEPQPLCSSVCYVDDGGSDANGGTSAADAKKTIQAAIDQVDANGTVRVLPGTYDETAADRDPLLMAGPATYQFGLFFGAAKPGITVMGVTAADVAITGAGATQAKITTNATNNFGTSGIFVEAAGTTIAGVEIGPNLPSDNKTIEVIADDFTLQDVKTSIPAGGGSIYINDFSTAGDVVQSYHVIDNAFLDGTSVDIASGAGNMGALTGRVISGNSFDLQDGGFNAISFSGTGGVPWYTLPVGGASITGNTFQNSTQYIRARGVYHEAQFDWNAFWSANSFPDGAAVALVNETTFDVRSWSYVSGPYTFTNVRRIGGTIQGEVNNAVAVVGDTVLVRGGTYPEDVVVNKSNLTLKGAGVDLSTIVGTAGDATLTTLEVPAGAPDVTVEGFTITRAGNTAAAWNTALNNQGVAIYSTGSTLRDSRVTGNRNGVFLYSATNVSILNNDIDFNRTGIHLVNDVSGLVARNNFITDNWTMGILFRDEGSPNATGTVTIKDNHIAGNWYSQVEARSLFSGPNLDVTENWLGTQSPTVLAAATSSEPGYSGQIPVAYGGVATAPGGTPTVIYNPVNLSNPIDYDPWLCTGTDASLSTIGFQPVSGALSPCDDTGPITSNVVATPNPAPINTSVTFTATVDDTTTGGSTIASAEYALDAGTWFAMSATDGAFNAISEAVTASAAIDSTTGIRELCVRGTDSAGFTGASTCIQFVVYDPAGGFVTGGGWIMSPVGAYTADPLLTGKAKFGFVSKYKKGASIPDGTTSFAFQAGDLRFSSTSYQWLVVNQGGTNAQFKGTGTINGTGTYGFMIWANDGSPDTFRIKITDSAGAVVYDNGANTPLGGGSIIIHKK